MGKIFEQGSPTVFKLHWNTGLHVLRGSNCRALDCFQKIRGCPWNGHGCDSLIVSYANMPVSGNFQDLLQDKVISKTFIRSKMPCLKSSLKNIVRKHHWSINKWSGLPANDCSTWSA